MRYVMQAGPDLRVVLFESRGPYVGVIKFSDGRRIKYHRGHADAEVTGLIIPANYKGLTYTYTVGPEHVDKARAWLADVANQNCPHFRPNCTINRRLSDALGHDRQGHKALLSIIRHGIDKPFVRMLETDFSAIPELGDGGIRRALAARDRMREGKA